MTKRSAFDIVVVGGGAAGCVVAARVAETGSPSVLLLEAGPDLRAAPPDDLRDGWHMTRELDWGYESEPDLGGEPQKVRRLKVLGGTSSLTRFALRGAPADYDGWAALGNAGWAWNDVLPYLRRMETDLEFGHEPWHGGSGPVPITRYPHLERTEILAATMRAFEAAGFPPVDDLNRPGAVGFGAMPMNSHDGVRVSSADAYLPPGVSPRNLTIRADSQVADVVLEGTRATGVRLLDGTVVEAGRVVLCAGTYGSPPILLRSGIGPADHLRSVGIPIRLDLPGVGANLADHPGIDLDSGYRGASRSSPVLHSVATFHSSHASSADPPDLLLWTTDPIQLPDGGSVVEVDTLLMTPRSRGSVRLRSADPTERPRIELPALDQPLDVERLAEGYMRAWEVVNQPGLRRLCTDPPSPDLHGDGLLGEIRRRRYSYPHVSGTCAMGPDPDAGAVVDASGRVHGTDDLFVVDASIMPTEPSAFTHIPTLMIAERLSEHIAALS